MTQPTVTKPMLPAMPVTPGILCENRGELALQLLRFEMHPAHHVPTYQFHMVHRETRAIVGNIRLSLGSTTHLVQYAGHIGYGVLPEQRGHRYAARAVRLLLPLACKVGLDPLWITCDPENLASRRTLELAGAEFIEIVSVPEDCIIRRKGHPRKCRYRLPSTPLATFMPLER
ncbi:MAG TPA: GNAT family N-acetyltransferase [Edaphobacter sp.]|jgi:tagatose 1,6-diphosphate aldolase